METMTMTTRIPIPPEVAAAAERLQRYYDTRRTNDRAMAEIWPTEHDHDLEPAEMRDIDRRTLADAYLSLVATQQQAAAEREKPVTEEWLQSLPQFQVGGLFYEALLPPVDEGAAIAVLALCPESDGSFSASLWQGTPDDLNLKDDHVALTSVSLKTRGELLDLLAALKIQVKRSE